MQHRCKHVSKPQKESIHQDKICKVYYVHGVCVEATNRETKSRNHPIQPGRQIAQLVFLQLPTRSGERQLDSHSATCCALLEDGRQGAHLSSSTLVAPQDDRRFLLFWLWGWRRVLLRRWRAREGRLHGRSNILTRWFEGRVAREE